MSNYPIPFDETRRQRVLDETGVLDEDAWAELDELTQSAAKHWNVPISVVSLVDRDRQFFKSCVGLDASETGRDVAFCAYTIMGEHAFVTLDAREDKRFKDNPLVTGAPHIRFYAGAPIVVENVVFGSFCVIDSEPRAHFSTEEENYLKAFAALAAQTITKRRLTRLGNLPLEERLQLAEKQSQYANKERASFLAMVSHELRTPLHQITGFVDLLKSEDISTLDGAQRKEYFQYICDGTEQMHELTESALTFAAADFGRLPLKPQKFSLQDAATRGLRLIAPETDLSGLTDLHMEGDPTHFAQIFSSIASTYKNNGADSVAIGCNPTMDKGISLIFEDGAAESDVKLDPQSFSPFEGSTPVLHRGQQGFDISLALADRLAKAHGARLSIIDQEPSSQLQLDIPHTLML